MNGFGAIVKLYKGYLNTSIEYSLITQKATKCLRVDSLWNEYTLDKGMIHVLGETEPFRVRFHHAT